MSFMSDLLSNTFVCLSRVPSQSSQYHYTSFTHFPSIPHLCCPLPPSLPQLGSRGVVRRLKQTGFNQRVLPQHRSSRQKEPSPGEQPAIKDCCTPLPDPYHNNTTSRNNYLFLLMWGFEVIPPSFFSTPYQTSHSLFLFLSSSPPFPSVCVVFLNTKETGSC